MLKKTLLLFLVASIGLSFALVHSNLSIVDGVKSLAATFFTPSVTAADLREKFQGFPETGKMRILIVPGHEPDFGGAEYGSLKEREMNVTLSLRLAELLRQNPHYDVVLTRDQAGWNPELKAYFDNNWNDIINWSKNRKLEMQRYIKSGQVTEVSDAVYHNDAPSDVALRLYGINKWSKERGFDVLIHVHFNDYPRYNDYAPGKYRGFAIYIPDKQYSNAVATREIAGSIYDQLISAYTPSDLPGESQGLVEDQDLIAIGARNSLDAASLLIEYGYIYRFADPNMRAKTIDNMAKLTAEGLNNFFQNPLNLIASRGDKLMTAKK